jgi:hypothetical protein
MVISTMDKLDRAAALKVIWSRTHRDFKGTFAGERTIMIMRNGGTTLVRLHDLTDDEIARLMPRKV